MPAAEVLGRASASARSRFERWTLRRPPRPHRDVVRAGLVPELARRTDWTDALLDTRRRNRVQWFESLDDDRSRPLFLREYAGQAEETRRRARRRLEHRLEIFGHEYTLGQPIDWHADPRTGYRWPQIFHRDIPILHDDRRVDVKHVWELNRHQFLVDIAKAAWLEGDTAAAAATRRLVVDWCAQNPVGFGVNWAGPLEAAYRALSWLWAYRLVGDHSARDADAELRWLHGFLIHGDYLEGHLERYSSPYNHLIGEAAVLFILGVLFPEFRRARRWQARGRRVLEAALAAQFYADGGSVEQAIVYHHATLGFYLLAALIARRNGQDLSAGIWSAIERAIEFSMHLMQPDGRHPAIGDNDDARPIDFERIDRWDFRHFSAIGAVLFDRGDFKHAARTFGEDAFWILGASGRERFRTLAAAPPPPSPVLRGSGYVVLRSGLDRHADYVCFDCGEQAGGLRHDDIPSAVHGHADALSVVASLHGQPVLVDAGLLTYNGDRDLERYFRETRAHNTVVVDGMDQALHLEQMAWAHAPHVRLDAVDVEARWAAAAHDGYARRGGVTHRRLVALRGPQCLIVCDAVDGAGTHSAELVWQAAPPLDTSAHGDHICLGDRFVLVWAASTPMAVIARTGGPAPADGWVAPSLDVRVPAARVSMTAQFDRSLRVVSVLLDRNAWTMAPTSGGRPALTLTRGSSRCTVVIDGDRFLIRDDAGEIAWPAVRPA
jgi:hypothetical protein